MVFVVGGGLQPYGGGPRLRHTARFFKLEGGAATIFVL
jgi:hypothetical protein